MEILKKEQYPEYEAFCKNHPMGGFTQSTLWYGVKNNWGHEVVVSRNDSGEIIGGMSVLIQKIPIIGTSFLYAPRGPVCDLHDRKVIEDLMAGAKALAKKHRAHNFKMDPDIAASDEEFLAIAKELGFARKFGPTGFETIQCRFNYRLYIEGKTEDEVFMNLTQ
ncbi:MAG: peptidoglycan bridge formation glycyltransferase FemA/FemB family protein, partial [Oscillospiraceae bacterium]|nr:peptidoglycan bridge formation glycyltransferase FemA/FemB family protein [Oscillospiraceae bacterium]